MDFEYIDAGGDIELMEMGHLKDKPAPPVFFKGFFFFQSLSYRQILTIKMLGCCLIAKCFPMYFQHYSVIYLYLSLRFHGFTRKLAYRSCEMGVIIVEPRLLFLIRKLKTLKRTLMSY